MKQLRGVRVETETRLKGRKIQQCYVEQSTDAWLAITWGYLAPKHQGLGAEEIC
jgi:hypothetical protein